MSLKILSIICYAQSKMLFILFKMLFLLIKLILVTAVVWCFTKDIQMRINNINESSDKNTIPKDNQQLYDFGKCMINCLIDNRNEECNKIKKCVRYCITPKPSSDTQDIPLQDHVTTERPDQKEMVTTETDYWNQEWDPPHDLYHSLHHADEADEAVGAVGPNGSVYERTTWPKGSRFTYENDDRPSFGIINFDNLFKFSNCQADCLRKYFIDQTLNANSFLSFMECSAEKCICIKNS